MRPCAVCLDLLSAAFVLTTAFGGVGCRVMLASAGTLSTQDAGQAGALFELLEETRSAAEVQLLWVAPLTSLSLIANPRYSPFQLPELGGGRWLWRP